MIRIHFSRAYGLSSDLIGYFGAGRFSHVDVLLPDGTLLGSRSDAIGGKPPGVQIRPDNYESWKYITVMNLAWVDVSKENLFYNWLKQQIGKPYDKLAIFGFVLDRQWRDPDSWFCSELVAAGLEYAQIVPFVYAPANKITPGELAVGLSFAGASWYGG